MNANYILLYVDNASKSRDFYQRLLDLRPVEDSETFVLFVLPSGVKLGLWGRNGVIPAANPPGGFELGFPVESAGDVDRLAGEWKTGVWKESGVQIIQEPADVDFGRTFVACDPDGHRLRVFFPGASQ
jgi:catechol 2,3-dioxygenase-like lactoylglutathione lyase family enzyme